MLSTLVLAVTLLLSPVEPFVCLLLRSLSEAVDGLLLIDNRCSYKYNILKLVLSLGLNNTLLGDSAIQLKLKNVKKQ